MDILPDIKVAVIDNVEGFKNLNEIWNRLVDNGTGLTVFQTFNWNYCWWRAYGDEHKLLILKIEKGSEIIGIVPLMITVGIIEFVGTPNADYSDFITTQPETCVGAVVGFFKKNSSLWNRIALSQIPESSRSLPVLENALGKSGLQYRLYPIENVMAFRYDGDDSKRAGFEVHKGGTIRKFINFFNKMDGLSLAGYNSPEEILERLPDFYHSHIVWWFRRGGDGCKFLNPKVRHFHDLAAKNMAGEGRVRLYILMHGNQPLAYLYAFIHGKTIYLYQIASLMNYRKKSPGILLLQLLVEAAVKEGFNVVDFSRGAGEHKERFANQSGRNMQCTIYASGLKKSLAAAYSGLKDSSAGRKFKNLEPVRKLKDRIVRDRHGDYARVANKTTALVFTGENGRIELEYYWKETGIFEKDTSAERIKCTEFGIRDMERIAAFAGIENDSGEYAELTHRFETGGRCFLALCEGHPAALGWILAIGGALPEKAATIMKDKKAGFIADVGISPVFETPRLTSVFYRFLCAECGKSGLNSLVTCIHDDRELAAALMEMGFRHL